MRVRQLCNPPRSTDLNSDGLILAQLGGVAVIRTCSAVLSFFSQSLKLFLQIIQLLVRKLLEIDKPLRASDIARISSSSLR